VKTMPMSEHLASTGDLPERLARELARPLPGRAAQARFAAELSYGRHFGPAAADARPAAVLVLLYRIDGQWHLPLTVRSATMVVHAGQISLPGGQVEAGETGPQAVLRELKEELGIGRHEVELLGALSPLYLFVSNFSVMPWVGWCARRPRFAPDPREVAEVLELPLAHLLLLSSHGTHTRRHRGVTLSAPHFQWGLHRIWGATAMILGELAELLARCGKADWPAPEQAGVEAAGESG
jgi:8-oxo-dGTP pyrophosphatase MutT (NUDIX family)